jgi:hypothetical protein
MADLFATGRVVDLILILMILETFVLVAHHLLTGRGIAIMPCSPTWRRVPAFCSRSGPRSAAPPGA